MQVILACHLAKPKDGIENFVNELNLLAKSKIKFTTHDKMDTSAFNEVLTIVVQFKPKYFTSDRIRYEDSGSQRLQRFLKELHVSVDISVDDHVTPSDLLQLCTLQFKHKIQAFQSLLFDL